MSVQIFNRLGYCVSRSKNLRGLLDFYRKNPSDLIVKVCERDPVLDRLSGHYPPRYNITFYCRDGYYARTIFANWRVLCSWLLARRTWSIDRVTFDEALYTKCGHDNPIFAKLRKAGIYVTSHNYQQKD